MMKTVATSKIEGKGDGKQKFGLRINELGVNELFTIANEDESKYIHEERKDVWHSKAARKSVETLHDMESASEWGNGSGWTSMSNRSESVWSLDREGGRSVVQREEEDDEVRARERWWSGRRVEERRKCRDRDSGDEGRHHKREGVYECGESGKEGRDESKFPFL